MTSVHGSPSGTAVSGHAAASFNPAAQLPATVSRRIRLLPGVWTRIPVLIAALAAGWAAALPAVAGPPLLNVSYDVSRELYADYNKAFQDHWRKQSGEEVAIQQSHGGSSKQIGAVHAGLEADVVTMNQQTDIDFLAKNGLVDPEWKKRFSNGSAPYTSTIVFLVRRGNPKGIKDWGDLVRDGVQVILPNPKTSGNGRYSYLAAWGYAVRKYGSDDKAREFVGKLFGNVPVLDTGGRAATTTFIQRGIGDVLLTFENEAFLTAREVGADGFEVVIPSISIVADHPVAIVEPVVAKKGTVAVAAEYLKYLWSEEGQRIIGRHYYRPRNPAILAEFATQFAQVNLFNIEDVVPGGWAAAGATHFADGGIFDQIYQVR